MERGQRARSCARPPQHAIVLVSSLIETTGEASMPRTQCFASMVMFTTMLLLPATGFTQQNTTVTGTVLYRERIALPTTAQVNVQLQDVSRADAARSEERRVGKE